MTIEVNDDILDTFGLSIYSDSSKRIARDIIKVLDELQYSLAEESLSCALDVLGRNSKVVVE